MVKTTRAQRESLFRSWLRSGLDNEPSYKRFRAKVLPMFAGDGAIIVPWCGMWLAIEPDGYTHS